MRISKKIVAFAAVSALTAATAVPAMALENEFHGVFRVRAIESNFDDGGAGPVSIGGTGQAGVTNSGKTPPTYSYIEQRARLMYIAKASDDLKLVTHFEFDSRFGDNSYNSNGTTRNNGGGIGADQTNLETKNIYLDFKVPSTDVRVKAGIQGFTDNYKGIIFNNDAAGVTAAGKTGNLSYQAGFFRFDDAVSTGANPTNTYYGAPTPTNATAAQIAANQYPTGAANSTASFGAGNVINATAGKDSRDFYTLGAKYAVSKDLVVGADYYLLYSDIFRATQDKSYVNMFGVNAEAKLGPATVSGFAVYQTGELATPTILGVTGKGHQGVSAFAGNLAAKMPVGPGTAKITALVLTGDSDTSTTGGDRTDFQTIMERGATNAGGTFFESGSMLLYRNPYATAGTDRAVVYDLNNNGRGIMTVFAGYDLLLGKLFINSNVGIGLVAKNNNNYANGLVNKGTSDVLGTELNTEIGYKVYDNLTASLSAAYMVLGDFYSNGNVGTPDNPYTTRITLNYTF